MGLNEWEVYEVLKGNNRYDKDKLKETEAETIIKGMEEYLLSRGVKPYDEMIEENINHIPTI